MSAQGSGIGDYIQAKTRSKFIQQANVPPPMAGRELQLRQGTGDLLEEARQVIENAVGQGQELSPMLYQMLGLQPTYEDNSAQLQQATTDFQNLQTQFNQNQQTIDTLRAIPPGKRTPAQRKSLHAAMRDIPNLRRQMSAAQTSLGQLQTMPKRITGLGRLDPNQIPPDSPFSPQNPLNRIEQQYTNTLQSALRGENPIDPTLAHQYDQQEAALRARLAAQYGPDYENSSVGQMALQAFGRTKADAFATYNRSIIDQYSNLAFGGAANLQSLLSGRINLLEQPSQIALSGGGALENTAIGRLGQENLLQQQRIAQSGLTGSTTGYPSPIGLGLGAAGIAGNIYAGYQQAQGQANQTQAYNNLANALNSAAAGPGSQGTPYYLAAPSQAAPTDNTAAAAGTSGEATPG